MKGYSGREHSSEITGLRAVAVLAVLFYHAGVPGFSGGYVGVDVFFVISGFLITRLITDGVDSGDFRFKDFYARRFRRLYPALLATLVLTLFAGGVFLYPNHLEQLSKSTLAALVSLSNFYFWGEAGYFDLSSEYKPLLHTWSLGLEEQFYLLWPVVVVLLLGIKADRYRLILLASLAVLSFVLSLHWVVNQPAAAFYLLPGRVFEFCMGALLLWLPRPQSRYWLNGLFVVGLAMVLVSIMAFSRNTPFPGSAALLPCGGAALLIQCRHSRLAWILSNRAMVAVGTISYSVYLVHWPLMVMVRYQRFEPLHADAKWLLVVASLLLGALLWRLVEQPFRYAPESSNRTSAFAWSIGGLVAVLAAMSYSMVLERGWSWRYDRGTVLTPAQIESGMQDRFQWTFNACKVESYFDSDRCDRSLEQQVLVLGDSHEADGFNIWRAAFGKVESQQLISFGSTNNCDLNDPDGNRSGLARAARCAARVSNLRAPAFLAQLNTIVYSASRPYSATAESFVEFMTWAKKVNPQLNFVFLGGYLMLRDDCSTIFNARGSLAYCADASQVTYGPADEARERATFANEHADTMRILAPVFIDKFELLCTADKRMCTTHVGEVPFAWDSHHLSFEFANYTGRLVRGRYEGQLGAVGILP